MLHTPSWCVSPQKCELHYDFSCSENMFSDVCTLKKIVFTEHLHSSQVCLQNSINICWDHLPDSVCMLHLQSGTWVKCWRTRWTRTEEARLFPQQSLWTGAGLGAGPGPGCCTAPGASWTYPADDRGNTTRSYFSSVTESQSPTLH